MCIRDRSYCNALKALGHEDKITDDMNWVIGPPLRKSFAQILPPELVEEAVVKYREFHAAGGLIAVSYTHLDVYKRQV